MAKDTPKATASSSREPAVVGEGRWARWGRTGFDKSIKISDWFSPYANAVSSAVGAERFWPQSDDMPIELEKCERILRAFTVEGIQQKDSKEEQVQDGKGNWIKKKVRVLRKIPPAAIRNAKGIAIYSSMRSGIAPLGGGGGSGVFMARLPDGSWSAPSAISPQNGAVGLLLGIDFLDVILLINSEKSMETFKSHRVDIGAETGLTAGPYGSGLSAEASYDKAPIYSYVRTRGMYAGVEVLGQVFLHRFDENERFYYWPGISAGDILTGKVRVPPVVYPLHRALRDAETGRAQGGKLERTEFDLIKIPESDVFKHLGPNSSAIKQKRFVAGMKTPSSVTTPQSEKLEGSSAAITPDGERSSLEELNLQEAAETAQKSREQAEEEDEDELVRDGERLRLPPTPAELEMMESAGIPDDEDLRVAREDRVRIYTLPPPPMHPDLVRHWKIHPTMSQQRRRTQLVMDGPHSAEVRQAQYVRLPPSPPESPSVGGEQVLSADGDEATDTSLSSYERQGEGIAKSVDVELSEKVMEAALQGEIEKAKRIAANGKAVDGDDATLAEYVGDAGATARDGSAADEHAATPAIKVQTMKGSGVREREGHDVGRSQVDRYDSADDSLVGKDTHQVDGSADGTHATQRSTSTDSMSANSHDEPFASLQNTPKLDVIELDDEEKPRKILEPAVMIDSSHVGGATGDAANINSTDSKQHDLLSSRSDTPTNDSELHTPITPVGVEDGATDAGSGKDTPTRPPRRKRPPKKGTKA